MLAEGHRLIAAARVASAAAATADEAWEYEERKWAARKVEKGAGT